jgi:hypothetical protein
MPKQKKSPLQKNILETNLISQNLLSDIITRIEQAKIRVAGYANSTLVMLY